MEEKIVRCQRPGFIGSRPGIPQRFEEQPLMHIGDIGQQHGHFRGEQVERQIQVGSDRDFTQPDGVVKSPHRADCATRILQNVVGHKSQFFNLRNLVTIASPGHQNRMPEGRCRLLWQKGGSRATGIIR